MNQHINRVDWHDPKLSNTNQQYKPTETVNQYQCRSDLNETKSLSDSYNSQNQGSTNINHNVLISSPVNHIKHLHSNSTSGNEHTSQSSVSNQPKSTSVSTIKASANSNLMNNNISGELRRRVTIPTSSVSSQKHKHEFSLNSESLNNTQTMKTSMSKEANNPVILRGNRNTSFGRNSQHNSVKPINYCHTNNKQQVVNTPSASSLITPSQLYSPSFSNYNQTYGTISLSQLHQLHTRKWAH